MAEKLRAFRWLGVHGPDQDRKGNLWIDVKHPEIPEGQPGRTTRRVVWPGDIVKEPAELASLGAERISEMIRFKQAESLEGLERLGVEGVLGKNRVGHDSSPQEVDKIERVTAESIASAEGHDHVMEGFKSLTPQQQAAIMSSSIGQQQQPPAHEAEATTAREPAAPELRPGQEPPSPLFEDQTTARASRNRVR